MILISKQISENSTSAEYGRNSGSAPLPQTNQESLLNGGSDLSRKWTRRIPPRSWSTIIEQQQHQNIPKTCRTKRTFLTTSPLRHPATTNPSPTVGDPANPNAAPPPVKPPPPTHPPTSPAATVPSTRPAGASSATSKTRTS